jgi:hypothetical protein
MRMVETAYMGVEIDTPADLARAERLLAERGAPGETQRPASAAGTDGGPRT